MNDSQIVYVVGCWLPSIHTDTSIQVGGTVPERTRNSDNICPFSRGTSHELLRVSALQMFQCPNMVIMTIATTRMYRSLINLCTTKV